VTMIGSRDKTSSRGCCRDPKDSDDASLNQAASFSTRSSLSLEVREGHFVGLKRFLFPFKLLLTRLANGCQPNICGCVHIFHFRVSKSMFMPFSSSERTRPRLLAHVILLPFERIRRQSIVRLESNVIDFLQSGLG
jgi:hypothetical protein